MRDPAIARFFGRVAEILPPPPGLGLTRPCQIWGGASAHGSPRARANGRPVYVRRRILEAVLGRPIERGLVAWPQCDRMPCIEPTHLVEVVLAEALRDRASARSTILQTVEECEAEFARLALAQRRHDRRVAQVMARHTALRIQRGAAS